ncbi:hypothetical protein JCM8097_004407 [Rhodosporidiobolus ruineniae]
MAGLMLLPAYVGVDTARALIAYALLNAGHAPSPVFVTFGSELLKLVVAAVATVGLRQSFILPPSTGSDVSTSTSTSSEAKPYLRFAVPAALYFINNILYLSGLQVTTPALLQVAVLSKLPLTALLHHFVVLRQRNPAMWISLGVLTLGLILAGAPEALWDALWDQQMRRAIRGRDIFLGPAIGSTIGVFSACASVYSELMLKEKIEFWPAQFYLYGWGTAFASIFALVRGVPASAGSVFLAYLVLVPVTACTGLLVATILRQRDNLVKLVGTALCIVSVYLLQHLFFPSVSTIATREVLGIGVLTISTWAYNFYKDAEKDQPRGPIYLELSTAENGELAGGSGGEAQKDSTDGSHSSSLDRGEPSLYRPTPFKLSSAATVVVLFTLLAGLAPTSDRSVKRDLARYFARKGVKPAQWGEPVHNPMCLFEKMNNSMVVNQKADLIGDFEEREHELGCPLYPIPDSGLIFHTFWSGPWRDPSHTLVTSAFLATQRLSYGHKLIIWYQGAGPSPAFRERFLSPSSPYSRYVEAREFVDDAEASGTCLEGMREWTDRDYAAKLEIPIQARSDLVRLLLLSKYGGVWLDADTIPLRDFTPLIRLGPSVATMPPRIINNNVLIYGPAWAGVGARMLDMACQMPYDFGAFRAKWPDYEGGSEPWWWIWNAGVHRLCAANGCGISASPLEWLDVQTADWGSHTGLDICAVSSSSSSNSSSSTVTGAYGPSATLPPQLHGPFAYHARLTTNHKDDDPCWDEGNGTPLDALRKRVRAVLEHLELGVGRDLFPGPGYVSAEEVQEKAEEEEKAVEGTKWHTDTAN